MRLMSILSPDIHDGGYAEVDVGAGLNIQGSVVLDGKGNVPSAGLGRGFAGPGGGLGAFIGQMGQVTITVTPKSLWNFVNFRPVG